MTNPDATNILLITTDTQRCDSLECMGSSFAISPHIDRLAAEGTLYTNAHTSSPVCMPARCSLITGTHAHVHGCIENGFDRHEHLPLLPDLLEQAGYRNIMVGKTHFGPVPDSFHVQHTVGEKNQNRDDAYAKFIESMGYPRATRSFEPNPVPEDLFMDSFIARRTIEEIDRAVSEHDGPFFAFFSMVSPHAPIDPPGNWASLFDVIDLPPLNYRPGEIQSHPAAMRALLGYEEEPAINEAEVLQQRRLYYALCAYCDEQVGRVIRHLDESGLRENTLVIFTSDHGQQWMDHGFNDKHNWYDESWHIPLVLSQPGKIPSGQRRGFATWHDLTATILAAAGVTAPTMQGYDLYTPIVSGKPDARAHVAASLLRSSALVTQRWKLEYWFEDQRGRLFDRRSDPEEQIDLWDDASSRATRDRLLEGLLAWRADSVDLYALQHRTHRGGPISKRATGLIGNATGLDAENRLDRICREIDAT